MNLEGGCLCAAIRYRISRPPRYSVICHCTSCRRAIGAMAVAWITVGRSEFHLLCGVPQAYRSSPGVLRRFCNSCGSSLTYERAGDDTLDVTTATLDEPLDFAPRQEIWIEHQVPWQPVNPTLPQFRRGLADDPEKRADSD